jgi:hypothetical protein
LEYGILEQVHGTKFHEKWIVHRAGHESELLEAPESIALFASGQTFDRVQQLKPFPADRGSLVALALAVVVPALPLIFTQVPLAFVLKMLLKALR